MAESVGRISFFDDLSYQAISYSEELPTKLEQEPVGLKLVAGDGQVVIVVDHDPKYHPRTLDKKLDMTNETRPVWEYNSSTGQVSVGSKVIMKLQQKPSWIYHFISMMGFRIWEKFIDPGNGLCDTTAEGVDPYTGDIKLGCIDCGGNRRRALADLGQYWLVETQDFFSGPNPELTYENAPQLHEVRTLIGNTKDTPWFVRPDPKDGDTIWPWMSKVPVVHEKRYTTPYPELPLVTRYHGYPVTITKYVFSGSNTYGYIENSNPVEDGWYIIEEMVYPIPSDTSYQANDRSWVVHIEPKDWVEHCPPPIDGWTRQETLIEKLLSFFNVY